MENTINGIQAAGVQATAKHWIGNEQETQRNPTYNGSVIFQESVSANIDDRTIHELYMWPFANAVHAKVSSIMCSYNRINGSYSCENSKGLNGLLKEELGFQGYIMSDWGATHSGVPSIEAGLDMDMPGGIGLYGLEFGPSDFGGNISTAVSNGTLDITRVDDAIVRILSPYFHLGQDVGFPSVDPSSADLNNFSPPSTWFREFNLTGPRSRDVRDDHGKLIRELGASATVLLKNVNNTLPLKAPKTMAIFGNDAGDDTEGYYNQADFEFGTLTVGGGSGTGRLTYLVTPLDSLKIQAAQDNTNIQAWLNNTLIANTDISTIAFAIPDEPEVCLVFLKTWAEEGADRQSLDTDWNGNEVVASVASYCSNTVVVTHSSGINNLPFADNPVTLPPLLPPITPAKSLVMPSLMSSTERSTHRASSHTPSLSRTISIMDSQPLPSIPPTQMHGKHGSMRSSRLITATSTHRTCRFDTSSVSVSPILPSALPTSFSPSAATPPSLLLQQPLRLNQVEIQSSGRLCTTSTSP